MLLHGKVLVKMYWPCKRFIAFIWPPTNQLFCFFDSEEKLPRFSRGEYLNFWNKINLFSSIYCYCDKRIVQRVLYGLHILSTLKHFNVQLNYRYRNDFSKRIQEPTWNSVGSRFKTNNASYWVVKKTMSAENIGGWVLHTIIFSPSQCLLSQQLSCSIMQVNEEISSKTFWTHLSYLTHLNFLMKWKWLWNQMKSQVCQSPTDSDFLWV